MCTCSRAISDYINNQLTFQVLFIPLKGGTTTYIA
uniref:Uncharacterized protein n=1 Tax=Arundo donax TaxID=35708 RepID=A0A0A8YB79_ARUDO